MEDDVIIFSKSFDEAWKFLLAGSLECFFIGFSSEFFQNFQTCKMIISHD